MNNLGTLVYSTKLLEENERLQAQIDELTVELTNTKMDAYELERLRDLFDEFKVSFDDADTLILCPLYAAREACGTEVSSELLAKNIDHAIYIETFDEIKEHLKSILNAGDLLIIMGAGDIAKLANSI